MITISQAGDLSSYFLRMATAAIKDFKISTLLRSAQSRVSICVVVPNLVTIGRPLMRYGNFSIFHNGGRRHLDFQNCEILTIGSVIRVKLRRRAKFRGDRLNCCWYMPIFRLFKMAAARHIGFVMRVFGSPTKGICRCLLLCKIPLESMQ